MFSPQNLLTEWSRLAISSLVRAGVRDAVISPGSRNTSLTAQALACAELRCHSVLDERAAGFFALGLARAGSPPPALICTSGSALAHYLPALIEASHAGLPVIVLSSDRPQELIAASAPQTIHQLGIFGRYAKLSLNLGDPGADEDNLRALVRKVHQAVCECQAGSPGPVHLNFPARKPLEPVVALTPEQHALSARVSRLITESPLRVHPSRLAVSAEAIEELASCFQETPDLLVSVGPLPTPVVAEVVEMARSQGTYVFSEHPGLATPVDGLARSLSEKGGSRLPPPSRIVHIGPPPVSSAWQAALKNLSSELYCLGQTEHPDPTNRARMTLIGDVAGAVGQLRLALSDRPQPRERAAFTAAYERAAVTVCEAIERETAMGEYSRHSIPPSGPRLLSEPALVKTILSALPAGTQLCLGNSLSVRLAAWVAPVVSSPGLTVHTQRGASGIDGLIAAASGCATSSGAPTLLLIGDVSAAHDLSSLAIARRVKTPLCIFILDNSGGGLFEHLPAAELFRQKSQWAFWTTPPEVDFGLVAQGYGARYHAVNSPEAATPAIQRALATSGATVLVARTNPESSLRFLRAMGPGPRPPGGFN